MKDRGKVGMTLIELLVVITIIGILVGILLPAFRAARNQARVTRANTEAMALKNAIKAYAHDYGDWPRPVTGPAHTDVIIGERNHEIFRQLTPPGNPGRKLFLEAEGYLRSGDTYVDPWGEPYEILMDLDANGALEVSPGNYLDSTDGVVVRHSQSKGWM